MTRWETNFQPNKYLAHFYLVIRVNLYNCARKLNIAHSHSHLVLSNTIQFLQEVFLEKFTE